MEKIIYKAYPFEDCVIRYGDQGTLIAVKFKGEKERRLDMKTSNLAADAVNEGKPITKAEYDNY